MCYFWVLREFLLIVIFNLMLRFHATILSDNLPAVKPLQDIYIYEAEDEGTEF